MSFSPPPHTEFDVAIDGALYETSPDCIKILTPDGTIRHLNPGGQIALELDRPDQLDGTSWPSLWPGSERQRVEHAVAEARAGKRTQFLAFCPTAKNTARWWDVMITPMSDAVSGVSGLLVVSRDVTELVQARETLAEASNRKSEFLTVLSHELRNPLSAMAMAARILRTFGHDHEQVVRVGETIMRQVGHMSRLAEDLLDISRITRGQVSLVVEEFDLRDAVRNAKEQLSPVIEQNKQVFHQSLPEEPVRLVGDQMRLTQVIGNLLGNATRYSPPHSPISLSLVTQNGYALVTVSDKGQGISDELMPKLFDMYSQAQATPDRKKSGVGLGLAIVKGLVELHGGTVHAESAGPGLGSAFTVSLPLKST